MKLLPFVLSATLLAGCVTVAGAPVKVTTNVNAGGATTTPGGPAVTTPGKPIPGGSGVALPPSDSAAVLPFKAGDKMEYQGSYGIGGAQVFPFAATIECRDATATEAKRTEELFVSASFAGGHYEGAHVLTRNSNWIKFDAGHFGPGEWGILPSKLEAGKDWTVKYGHGFNLPTPPTTGTAKVEGIETVVVKAGSFPNTYRVRYSDRTDANADWTLWIAPGVGIVKASIKMKVVDKLPLPKDWLTVTGSFELGRVTQSNIVGTGTGTSSSADQASVTGTISVSKQGLKPADLTAWLFANDGVKNYSTKVGADGKYTFKNVRIGTYGVEFGKDGAPENPGGGGRSSLGDKGYAWGTRSETTHFFSVPETNSAITLQPFNLIDERRVLDLEWAWKAWNTGMGSYPEPGSVMPLDWRGISDVLFKSFPSPPGATSSTVYRIVVVSGPRAPNQPEGTPVFEAKGTRDELDGPPNYGTRFRATVGNYSYKVVATLATGETLSGPWIEFSVVKGP